MERRNALDIAKGIGILSVVVTHVFLAVPQVELFLTLLMNNFLMPLFFWVAGYNYKSNRTAVDNLKRRIPPLLRIYLCYSAGLLAVGALFFALLGMADAESIRNQILTHFAGRGLLNFLAPNLIDEGMLWSMAAPLWYLVQLILASILFYLLAESALKSSQKTMLFISLLFLTSALITFLCPQLPFNLQTTPVFTAYMLLGAWCGKIGFLDRLSSMKSSRLLLMIVCFEAVQMVLSWFFRDGDQVSKGYFSMDPDTHVIAIFVVLLQALIGIPAMMGVCICLEKTGRPGKVLAWIGRNTLPYYLLHMEIAMLLAFVTGALSDMESNPARALVKTLLILFMTLGICTLWVICETKIKSKMAKRRKK